MAKKHYSHQQIRKSIKKDEIREALDWLLAFGKKHMENLLISAILVAVFAILVPLYFNNRNQNELRAESLLNRAINISLQPVAEGLADASKGDFRTLAEKYKKLQEAYNEITGTYRATQAAKFALAGQGDAEFYMKEYGKAMALYQEAKTKIAEEQLQWALDQKIAACLENQGKWQEAATAYQTLMTSHPKYFNRQAVRLALARCYAQAGQAGKARELFEQASQDEPGTYWAELAKSNLQMLEKTTK